MPRWGRNHRVEVRNNSYGDDRIEIVEGGADETVPFYG